jgi:hypothetical protein
MLKKYLFLFALSFGIVFSAITIYASVPYEIVLEPNPNNSWENQTVTTPYVIFDYADGVYKMWYSGNYNTKPEYIDDGIGYATSVDGVHWQNRQFVHGIGSGYSEISHPWVVKFGSTYRIWHRHYYDICAGEWSSYINYCESPDGINWGSETYNFGCPGKTWELYEFYLGSMVEKEDTTFLYYSAVMPSRYQAIGRASSTDGGNNWFDRIKILSPDSVVYNDSVALNVNMPNVTLRPDGSFLMFFAFDYYPYALGRLAKTISHDGIHWTNIQVFLTPEMLGANVTDILTPFYFKDKDGKEYLYFAFTEAKGSTKIARISLEPPTIPTLTEWGLIIFGVVLLGFISWMFLKRRKAVSVRL